MKRLNVYGAVETSVKIAAALQFFPNGKRKADIVYYLHDRLNLCLGYMSHYTHGLNINNKTWRVVKPLEPHMAFDQEVAVCFLEMDDYWKSEELFIKHVMKQL